MIGSALKLSLLLLASSAVAGDRSPAPSSSTTAAKGKAPASGKARPEAIRRGEYLVRALSCDDCHTPMMILSSHGGTPMPDMSRRLSGHPSDAPDPQTDPTRPSAPGDSMVMGLTGTVFRFPFGVVYAANLTPHESGLGGWTKEMFIAAMRKGRHLGGSGRPILAPMPWSSLAELSDSDLEAIFAFLRTVPPVDNPVPEPKVDPEMYAELDALQPVSPQPPGGSCCYFLRTRGARRCGIVSQCSAGACPAKLIEKGVDVGVLYRPAKPVASCAKACPALTPAELGHPVCD